MQDPSIGAMVVTGNEKAFAAGADIKEMQDEDFAFLYMNRWLLFAFLLHLVFGMAGSFTCRCFDQIFKFSFPSLFLDLFFFCSKADVWSKVAETRKPVIAAVNGKLGIF